MRRSQGLRTAVSTGLLGIATLAAGGLVAALVVLPGPVAETSAVASASDGSVIVSTESFDGAKQVSVRATVTPAESLTITDTGRVTDSACEPGGTVESGDVVLLVEDRPVIALATDIPLWRDLQNGSRGDDVQALQNELVRMGHDLDAEGYFGAATRAAVRALQEDAGVGRPDGALGAASVLWLPQREVTVAECTARLGDQLAGGEVATIAGGLMVLTVVEPPGEGWVLRHDQLAGAIDADGAVTDPELLAMVESSESFRQSQDEGTDRLTMEIALAEKIDVAVVPPSAIVATGDGHGCLRSGSGEARRAEVVASALGQTMVHFVDAEPPRSVQVRPDPVVC